MRCPFLEKAKIENEKEGKEEGKKEDADVKGIPSFWLTIFKNVDMLSEMVQVSLMLGHTSLLQCCGAETILFGSGSYL